jgi:lipoprotein-anchoring transpeptidase ErfK/SrfK
MRSRLLLLSTLAVVVLLLVGAGGVFAYDRSHDGKIAEGIRINGIPVGGLSQDQAEQRLRERILAPLSEPVKAAYHGTTYTLTSKRAQVGLDLRGSTARALAASREGNVLARTWRTLRGKPVDRDVAAKITYSTAGVDALVSRVRGAIDRPAKDAKVDLSSGKVDPTEARTGRRVLYNTFERAVTTALLDTRGARTVEIPTKTVRPEVTNADLREKYPAVLVIDRSAFKLTLYKDLKPAKTYPIAVGQIGLETPAGLYTIQNKAENPAWHVPNSDWAGDLAGKVIAGDDPANPIKARWMGIYDGAGIHGTSEDGSIGSAASHGCIRMHIPDVEELYPQVPVGAPVYIA